MVSTNLKQCPSKRCHVTPKLISVITLVNRNHNNHQQCVCLTNFMSCSTSNPECHETLSKQKTNVN